MLFAGDAAASPAEAQRFTQDPISVGEVLYTTSNSWLEVNYTQLVANVKEILPQIKLGAIPLAMVKVSSMVMMLACSTRVIHNACLEQSASACINPTGLLFPIFRYSK